MWVILYTSHIWYGTWRVSALRWRTLVGSPSDEPMKTQRIWFEEKAGHRQVNLYEKSSNMLYRSAARSSNTNIPSASISNEMENKKQAYTPIPDRSYSLVIWRTRISGHVIMALGSLHRCFRNNSYLKYLSTGSNRDTLDCPSQRVQVHAYVLHVPGIGYD